MTTETRPNRHAFALECVADELAFLTEYGQPSLSFESPKIVRDVAIELQGPTTILRFWFYPDGELHRCELHSSRWDGIPFDDGWPLDTDDEGVAQLASIVWGES